MSVRVSTRVSCSHFEYLARTECPFELTDELLQVVLNDPVQIDQVAVDVVENLNLCRHRAEEKQSSSSCERLYIAGVAWEQLEDPIGEPTFAPYPGDDGLGGHDAS